MRKWLPLGLALLLPVVAACSDFSHPIDRPPSQNNNQHRALSPAEMKARIKARTVDVGGGRRVRAPAPDMDMQGTGSYPKPVSAWQANERKLYASLLAGHSYEVEVVPCQVEIYGFDQPTRSLMTIELARAIERAQGKPLPDPYVVERAFGDGIRRPDYRPNLNVGAKRIISCYVGHLPDGMMTITIGDEELNPRPTGSEAAAGRVPLERYHVHSYEHLAFSDQNPPLEVYRAMLPKILKDLGYDAVASPKRVESSFTANKLPATPLGLTGGQPDPARDAYYLQLLGALTPRREERERERLFEKSLLAIERMKRDSPQYRALKARAYMHLGQRPTALKVLGMPSTAEEKALRAALNGNLPELKASIARETQLVPRMLEMLEANEIAADYGVLTQKDSAAAAASLKLPGKIWPVVATRAFIDWDGWSQQDNLVLKQILDKQLPIQGFTAEGIVRGAAAIGDLDKVRTNADLSVLEHVHRLLAADPEKWCCEMPVDRITTRDYLDFIGATATDNLMRRAHYFTMIQGSPDSALKFLSSIQSVYDGYPEFALERAYAESRQAQQVAGPTREGLGRAAYLDALNAMYWSNGQTRIAADAFSLAGALRRMDFGNIDNWYADDLPFRSFFPGWEHGGDVTIELRNERAALRNSVSDFWPFRDLEYLLDRIRHDPAEMQKVLARIKGRFGGCPERDLFFAKMSMKKNDVAAAEAHMREGISDAPGDWRAYESLGELYFKHAQPEKAAQVYMGYPGFRKNAPENAVAISNHAYVAGSDFYWSGEFALAKPLYHIAADLDTGSDASLSSAIRLAMLKGNYVKALAVSLIRAQRYNSPYAYRDYLGLLHAMGHSKEAWSAFDALVPKLRASQLWETALVGQRIQRMSEAEIVAWVNHTGFRDIGKTRDDAAVYLVRAGITDRMPSDSLAKSVAALAWPVWRLPQWHGDVVRDDHSNAYPRVLGPKAPNKATLPIGVFRNHAKEPVTSDLVSFVKAYRELRLGNASGAVKIFRGLTPNYDLTNPELRYLLPYYAFAAARSGETSAVESILNRIELDKRGFDYFLAKAAISGLAGKTKDALSLLKRAHYQIPYTLTLERPVYTKYQYAEMLEWLYNVTGKPEYRDLALDWVKKVERFTPWYAWPYAMQAELDRNKAGRRRAIAMTAYLDPGSERLAKLPKAKVARAVRAFKGHNPFLQVFAKPNNNGI